MSILQFTSRATNMQCHNMCEPKSLMPGGVKSLLGMGLKFCVKSPRPTNKITTTVDRITRSIRLCWYFKYHPPPEEPGTGPSYIPGLYINNTDWEPPKCDDPGIEKSITAFGDALRTARKPYDKPTTSNLTPRQ